MKNSAGRGGCYPPRPKAEVDNIRNESIMAARIFLERESKQTRACAAHDSAPLSATIIFAYAEYTFSKEGMR